MVACAFSLISQQDLSTLETEHLQFCYSLFKNMQEVQLQSNYLTLQVEREAYTCQCCTLYLILIWVAHFTVRSFQ